MPTYDFECEFCGHHQSFVRPMKDYDLPAKCELCQNEMVRDFSAESCPHVSAFHDMVFEGIAPQPVSVNSMKELDRVCKEHGSHIETYDRQKIKQYREKRRQWDRNWRDKGCPKKAMEV